MIVLPFAVVLGIFMDAKSQGREGMGLLIPLQTVVEPRCIIAKSTTTRTTEWTL
jgi:hypothetical protein